MARRLVLLGSTGSIGRQTLDVVRRLTPEVEVYGLVAGKNVDLLRRQAREFGPTVVAAAEARAGELSDLASDPVEGDAAIVQICTRREVDLVVVATSGEAGLVPTLAALAAGKLVALANKEALVSGGPVISRVLREASGQLVPIDSEHSAIWQCLQGEPYGSIERLILTASGGALRHLSLAELAHVTPNQALAHPTWSMGRKITIDSANLMNKGLEVLEARWLFDLPLQHIDVLMHPESVIHSLVTFVDGSTKAQLSPPDMRLPIQYALSHPARWPNVLERLDLAAMGSLHFSRVDHLRYPALSLAIEAGQRGGTFPAVLVAANEVAVQAFLSGRLTFDQIPGVVEKTLEEHAYCSSPKLDDILEASTWARQTADRLIAAQ